jgi:aryl-alcohol dehydrogenase-like predicted oxidoreductase
MKYKKLGDSSLEVSELCLGSMTWGEQNTENQAHEQIDYALDRGINFIDTAEMYPVPPKEATQGLTESYIGSWLLANGGRDRFILATKVAGPAAWLPHLRGGPRLDRRHIIEALEASLSRLQTDYVDLYQLHWPERATNYFGQLGYVPQNDEKAIPMRDTMAALKDLIEAGKIRHYGLSNETPWGLMHCLAIAKELNMPRPVSVQNPYNLLNRSYEVGLAECSYREGVGLLAYSPLAFGVLTGKYLNGAKPAGARITLYERFSRYAHERANRAVAAYDEVAKDAGLSLCQLALTFVNSRPFVTSNIIGATSLKQLQENISSIDVSMSSELLEKLELIHQDHTYPCP